MITRHSVVGMIVLFSALMLMGPLAMAHCDSMEAP